MKVFISWSGEQSKAIASEFKEWIPAVIQAVKPYFSSNDIDKGSRWATEISKELEQSKVGLICLTRENLEAPWIMFEAGALSKSIESSKVCPMLFGVETTDLTGPLIQFQATVFNKQEVNKLMQSVNSELGEIALAQEVLESVFNKWWPDLESKISEILAKKPEKKATDVRSERDLLEEILTLTRQINREKEFEEFEKPRFSNIGVEEILSELMSASFYACKNHNADTALLMHLLSISKSVSRLIRRTVPSNLGMKMMKNLSPIQQQLEETIEFSKDIPF